MSELRAGPPTIEPFRFASRLDLTLLTNRRARDLAELAAHIETVPGSAIYFHTHHFLEQYQFLSPEPANDFARWVAEALQEERLGEQLAAIDVAQLRTIRALRERLAATIRSYVERRRELRAAPIGLEFHFREAVSFVLPTELCARDLGEFADRVEGLGSGSLAHHFFDARLRLERGENDFSEWLRAALGEEALARAIARLDPYAYTLDGLRAAVVRLARRRLAELRS